MDTACDGTCAFALLVKEGSPLRETPMHCEWSDILAVKAAREVLMGVRYPDDEKRRALYASWLRAFASDFWQKGFQDLILRCVAATPSPSNPEVPLFADIFRVEDPVDRSPPRGFVLSVSKLPILFSGKQKDVEPLPESSPFLKFMADLIRKGSSNRPALNEAGMIIGFCSLALAVIVAKPRKNVQEFFLTQTKVLTAVVPTTFDGDILWPMGKFITALTRKAHSPFIPLLAVGQYIYYLKAGEEAPRADVKFLMEAFMAPTKFGRLEAVELFCNVQEQTGLSTAQLGQIFAEGSLPVVKSSDRISAFLEHARKPTQQALPWCRATSCCFFSDMALSENVDYAMRLTAFLAPGADDKLWKKPEFKTVCEYRVTAARVWARDLERALRKGKYGDLPNWKP